MAKNSNTLLEPINTKKFYRHYLWVNNKRDWLNLILNNFIQKFRPFLFIILLILPTITVVDTIADGTNNKQYMLLQIQQIQTTLPQLEKAYLDIDKLSNSISKVAYKDLNQSFIYAFLIVKWSRHYGIDPMEFAAVIQTESEFNQYATSKIGAKGLAQINTKYWSMLNPYDGEENIKTGARILHFYKNSYPSSYLNFYSGGALNYKQKVLKNTQKINKS